jgi:hypothetical protein
MFKKEVANAVTEVLTDEQLGLVSAAGNGPTLHATPYADLFAPAGAATLINANGRIVNLDAGLFASIGL